MNTPSSQQKSLLKRINRLIPSCQEMTRLSSERLDHPMSLGLRFRMAIHYLMCSWCRRYARHLQFLHRVAPGAEDSAPRGSRPSLPDDVREKIRQRLRDER
jgi:hypothetical protein